MRIKVTETKVYTWGELTDEQKEGVLENYWDINVYYEWWDSVYDDAANIGIEITSFDLDRGRYCEGKFTQDAVTVAENIIKDHGESCETYKTAKKFLDSLPDEPDDDEKYGEYENTIDSLEEEFKDSILEDYRIMLEEEFKYRTSEEAIIDTIEANEYEFDEHGKIA